MPKNLKSVKVQGGIRKERGPNKFRIGNRKTTKPGHMMTTEALKEALDNTNLKKQRNKIVSVLRSRGVEVDWPAKLVEEAAEVELA